MATTAKVGLRSPRAIATVLAGGAMEGACPPLLRMGRQAVRLSALPPSLRPAQAGEAFGPTTRAGLSSRCGKVKEWVHWVF